MKNFLALTLMAVATIALSNNCDAIQGPGGRKGRQGPPGGGPRGGERGPRGGDPMEMMARIPVIKALDANSDGKISTAEMRSAASALAKLDKNKDGVLDASEIMPARPQRGERGSAAGGDNGFVDRMLENDADGDGKVSHDEAPQRMQRIFDRLDADEDGFLTEEEIVAASKRFSDGARGGRRGGKGKGVKGGVDGGQRPRRPAAE